MANSTNINNPETTTNAQIQGAGLVLPLSVNERDPNKISTLFTPNSSVLYSKYSPYPEGQAGGFFGANQPYIVTNINDANKGINSTLKYVPYQPSALIDVIRVTKFSASNPGIKFLLKQVYLQGYQPFNETKLYNPLMPIQSTVRASSFGILDRPLRHIEPNLGGVLGALGLKGIAGAFGFNPPNPPPRGTAPGVGGTPLSSINQGAGKGLTRGGTATSAYSGQNYSYLSNPSKTGFLKNIGNFFKSSTLFGTFFAIGQPAGTTYKGDDQTYRLMINNKTIRSFNKSGDNTYGSLGVVQRFAPDNRDLEGATTYDKYSRYVGQYNSSTLKYSAQSFYIDINSYKLSDGVVFSAAGNKTYFSGIETIPGYEASDMLFLYTDYLTNNNYPTKLKSTRKIDYIIHSPDFKKGYTIEYGGYIKDTGIIDQQGKPVNESPIITDQYDKYIDPKNTDATYPTKFTSIRKIDSIVHSPDFKKGYTIKAGGYIKDTEILDTEGKPVRDSPIIKNQYDKYIDSTFSEISYPTKLTSLDGTPPTEGLYTRKQIDQIRHKESGQGYTIEAGGYIKDTEILDTEGKPVEKSPIITNQYDKYIDPVNNDATYPTKLTSKNVELSKDHLYNRTQLDQIKHNPSGQGYVIDPNGLTKGYEDKIVDTTKDPIRSNIERTFESKYVIDKNEQYPTTFIKGKNDFGTTQIDFANEQNQALKGILSNYTFVPPTDLKELRSIIDSSKSDKETKKLSYLAKYREYKKVDLLDNPDGKGFAGVNQSDLINVLNVQSNTNGFINKDLIKFYFYDIYNQKYIPFRATVKGISERSVSSWDDFQYIGNADKVYNYKGFTRGLGFSFNVVAMSVKEMLPMWQRINYLMGLTKPANYKNGFIVPPLVMMTIGDIYNNQPIVINSINMTIPDNATWETVSDSYNISQLQYLNGRLKSKKLVALAQFPREAEISIDANILEKETPKVGRNNFGDVNIGGFFESQLSIVKSEKQIRKEEEIRQEEIRKQEELRQIRQSGALELFEQRRDELQNLA